MTEPQFRIRPEALDVIVAHARAEAPAECCGLLVGASVVIGASGVIEEASPAVNVAGSPTRFLIHPRDHIAARRAARLRGLEVIGFYHSHVRSPARPSPSDVAEAAYPDAVHLIVSLEGGAVDARLFRIGNGSAVELRLAVTPRSVVVLDAAARLYPERDGG